MREAYQITNEGIDAVSSGKVVFGEGKLDDIDAKILKILMGEETLNDYIAENIPNRIHRLERKGYIMKVKIE